jgi:hypothetical protein
MATLPNFALNGKTYTPAPGAKVFLASWDGFSGLVSTDAMLQPLFRSHGTAWLPLTDLSVLSLYDEVPAAWVATLDQDAVALDLAGLLQTFDARRADA